MAFFALSLLSVLGLVVYPVIPKVGRQLVTLRRNLAGRWSGVQIPQPYLQGGWRDRATWRDLAFLAVDPFVGLILTAVPSLVMIYACWGLLTAVPLQLLSTDDWGNGWYGQVAGSTWLAVVVMPVLAWLVFRISPACARANSRWVRVLLSPTKKALLELRVRELNDTRAAATDVQAAELRRIERDLHDGAQARLVAMGLELGAVERLIDSDPVAAKAVLAKVQDNSARALVELRELVRGIHPPVLAERGLGDAVRALALDMPLPVEVSVDLHRRLAPPVESAAYFAISEALAGVVTSAHVSLVLTGDVLAVTVSGTDMSSLREIERRLGAFDGTVTVTGPATLRMTLTVG
jgi:signal transduction histidine kinase